jgi:hypothetical protein
MCPGVAFRGHFDELRELGRNEGWELAARWHGVMKALTRGAMLALARPPQTVTTLDAHRQWHHKQT